MHNHGSPSPVPSKNIPLLTDAERQLSHGSHGAQGGERGNEYQAVWMTLACLNAVYSPITESQLTEIILEGFREPFDDIELRKNNGVYTLFQSKHRDKAGSNNVTIGELLVIPSTAKSKNKDKEGSSSDKTAFSLAKYFKGMMIEVNRGIPIINTNFIICVSATFSVQFKVSNSKKYTMLEPNTWTSQGILTELEPQKIDSFFSKINFRNQPSQNIKSFLQLQNPTQALPQYMRFSENFIQGVHLTESQQILRNCIFDSIKKYIDQELQAGWVTTDMYQRKDDYIAYFLRNLQLWFHQPKLEALKGMLTYSLRNNFVLDCDKIYEEFYSVIKDSANRNVKSLDLQGITHHLRTARGVVLANTLKVKSRDYRNEYLLPSIKFIHESSAIGVDDELFSFLNNRDKNNFILYSKEPEDLKYLVYSCIDAMPTYFTLDEWAIVNATTNPLFQQHPIQGDIDHIIEDLFFAKKFKLIAIDNAGLFLNTEYGKKQLKTLVKQKSAKVILICHQNQFELLSTEIALEVQSLGCSGSLDLDADNISEILRPCIEKNHCFNLLRKTNYLSTISLIPSLITSLSQPTSLVNFINSLKLTPDKFDPQLITHFLVKNYHPQMLCCPKPYYKLENILKTASYRRVCLQNIQPGDQEHIKKIIQIKTTQSENKKHLYFHLNRGESYCLYLNYHRTLGETIVSIESYKPNKNEETTVSIHFMTNLSTEGFLENEKLTLSNYSDLINRTALGQRYLIITDYGTGKSSLLKQLFMSWHTKEANPQLNDLVIPCQLTHITEAVQKNMNLCDILIKALQDQHLVEEPIQLWFKKLLRASIKNGRLLILFDRWDELYETQYQFMSAWLNNLPYTTNFIIASRPHAVPSLRINFHRQILLNLFIWQDIESYIHSYFAKLKTNENALHQQFIVQLLTWLGNGDNKIVNDLLARPLHLSLLCESLNHYYQQFCNTMTPEEAEQVSQQAPWKDSTFYRVKLYQLIIYEQLRKYIVDQVQANPLTHASEFKGVCLFTQVHQLRLREIGFELIFQQEPIRLISAFDEQLLLSELYNLGILSSNSKGNKIEFVYQTFSEYFAAQYLLNALLRGHNDFLFENILNLIRTHANDPRFEQVWRILGEMLRYGDPFLNYRGINSNQDVFLAFPYFANDDLTGFYYGFLHQCLNGKNYHPKYHYGHIANPRWFEAPDAIESNKIQNDYVQTHPINLVKMARHSKNSALGVIKHLIATNLLSDNWLIGFYHKQDVISQLTESNCRIDITRTLENLANKVNNFPWQEYAWGGYWDIDVFLPCVGHMHSKLYVMGAAYFIHRILNKNNIYYDTGLASTANQVIENLVQAELDISSTKLFFMMTLKWLGKHNLINTSLALGMNKLLTKILEAISSPDIELKILSINLLYAFAFVFKLKIGVTEFEDLLYGTGIHYQIIMKSIASAQIAMGSLTAPNFNILLKQFKKLEPQTNFENQTLPGFNIDGSDLIAPETILNINELQIASINQSKRLTM